MIRKMSPLLIVFIFFFEACSCPKRNLDKSEKQWVEHFKVGDKSVYQNSKGDIDTLIVSSINNYYTPCNRLELSEYQNEISVVSFNLKSKNSYAGIESFITMTSEEWKKRIPYIYFGNLGPRKINSENPVPRLLDTVLNGRNFKSVTYYVKDVNTEQYGDKNFFLNFYWSKQIGLIAYTTIGGEFFVRVGR